MRIIVLLVCIAYWGFLTVLLLAPDPARVVGLEGVPEFPWGDTGAHFTGFLILTLLAHATRWPAGLGWPIFVLLGYAVAGELLQAFVPPRTVELGDLLANLVGIAVGSGMYWVTWRLVHRRAIEKDRYEVLRWLVSAQRMTEQPTSIRPR